MTFSQTKQKFSIKIKNIAIISLIAIFFILDRILKQEALKMGVDEELILIPKILTFNFQKNTGLALSLPLKNSLATIISAIIIIILIIISGQIWHSCKLKKTDQQKFNFKNKVLLGLFLIILGALSNLFDRLILSYVIDYFLIANFIIINLADILISLGAIYLLIIISLFDSERCFN